MHFTCCLQKTRQKLMRKLRCQHSWLLNNNKWTLFKISLQGLPGGSVVKSLPTSAGDTSLIPYLGRSHILRSNWAHAPQLWNLCSRAQEPQVLKAVRPIACAQQHEKPPQWEAHAPQLETSPCSPQLEKSLHNSKDPKINFFFKF